MDSVRLLHDPPAAGAWNMAVDEALLASAAGGIATLRFYQWAEPTLSLGYFQAAADRALHSASEACPLVRRASGGGAILHDQELTYSLAIPARGRFGAAELYDRMHGTLIEVLAGLGVRAELCGGKSTCDSLPPATVAIPPEERAPKGRPPCAFLCFQRLTRGDVLCSGAKIAGSAQRRHRGGLLQHGSVLLRKSTRAPELPGIAELTSVEISAAELAARWVQRLSGRDIWRIAASQLTSEERWLAEREQANRFANEDWNYRK
ncbi:MAG: biotin/lipoate A/B protein ligase family protein [Pirellulaceae bacterium]|nr:biotin/lipoate A/B protein ligase family protein [Pirellulaceae bacterium]